MPRLTPLLPDTPPHFAVAELLARGVSRDRLTRSDLRSPFPGVRASATSTPASHLKASCIEYAPRLKPWQFFSHETALFLAGAPMPEWPHRPQIHVAAHRPAREPRVDGVRGHRLQLREPAIRHTGDGLPFEHPVRAFRQAGSSWRLDDLIAAGDFLIYGDSPLATVGDLLEEVELMGDTRNGLLRRAVAHLRSGVRSPRETRLRLCLVRAGLPEPVTAWVLRDARGRFIAELDLAYPEGNVAPEYDGRVHELDPAQFAKDADRWDRIRAAGWDHVRVLNHHMRGSGDAAVRKVRNALIAAGWRPGSASTPGMSRNSALDRRSGPNFGT